MLIYCVNYVNLMVLIKAFFFLISLVSIAIAVE